MDFLFPPKERERSHYTFYSRENMGELKRRDADLRSGKSALKEHELIEVD